MGCKVLDFLPLTNKPDLEVLSSGLKKIKEENETRVSLSREDLNKLFIEKCVEPIKIGFTEKRADAKIIDIISEEIISYLVSGSGAYNAFTGEKFSFTDKYRHHYPDSVLYDAFDKTMDRINFKDINEESSMANDSRYNLIMNNLPRANMEDVRELAKNLHMVIIPIEFSHPKVLFGNDQKLLDMFNMFNNNSEDDLYVMCPVNFYNHYRHLISKSEKDMFIPEKFQSAFDALEMTRGTLSFILDKIDENSNEIVMLNKRIENLANRVDILENIEKERREEQLRKEMEFKYKSLDPMIINIPRGTSVNEWDGETKIHMLWGEDLPDILTENNKLKVFKENKNAYPEKVYDYIAKSDVFKKPAIRFTGTERLINSFYKDKHAEIIIDHYKNYINMTGGSIHHDMSTSVLRAAVVMALKTIRERVNLDMERIRLF